MNNMLNTHAYSCHGGAHQKDTKNRQIVVNNVTNIWVRGL